MGSRGKTKTADMRRQLKTFVPIHIGAKVFFYYFVCFRHFLCVVFEIALRIERRMLIAAALTASGPNNVIFRSADLHNIANVWPRRMSLFVEWNVSRVSTCCGRRNEVIGSLRAKRLLLHRMRLKNQNVSPSLGPPRLGCELSFIWHCRQRALAARATHVDNKSGNGATFSIEWNNKNLFVAVIFLFSVRSLFPLLFPEI